MTVSKSSSTEFAIRGGILLLGCSLLLFYVYPPLLLFARGQNRVLDILRAADTFRSLQTSLEIAVGVFVLSSVLGGILAWLVVKTDFPFKGVIEFFTFISFTIPPYILALSWMQIFGRNGYLERIVRILVPNGSFHPNPYSIRAVIIVMTLHLYPLMFLSLRNALEKVPPDLEKAALLSGATQSRAFVTVTLPLILPSLFSTGFLVFSRTIANFAVPALLCLPVGINTLPTGIYSALSSLRTGDAAALSLLLVAISTGLHGIQGIILHKERILQSGGRSKIINILGKKKYPLLVGIALFYTLACLIPILSMFLSSLLLRWGLPLQWRYLTLNNYRALLFGSGKALRAFANSLFFGGSAALLASAVGTGALLMRQYQPSLPSRIMEAAATWPMAIPNTVLAIAAIFAWNRPPLKFYGTPMAIIITYTVLFTPLVMKQVSGLLATQSRDILYAARTAGASKIDTFFRILLPLLAPGYKAGFLICLMIALREIPISLMLYSSGQETVGVLLFGMQSQSYGLEMTSALAIIVILLILGGNLLQRTRKKQ